MRCTIISGDGDVRRCWGHIFEGEKNARNVWWFDGGDARVVYWLRCLHVVSSSVGIGCGREQGGDEREIDGRSVTCPSGSNKRRCR